MSEIRKRVEDSIVRELQRQKIAARSWGNSFDGLIPPVDWSAVARSAIEATREPTEAMVRAAKKLYATPPEFVDVSFVDYWHAMHDEMMTEK